MTQEEVQLIASFLSRVTLQATEIAQFQQAQAVLQREFDATSSVEPPEEDVLA